MDLKDLKIELRPHVAVERKQIGGAVVDVPQDFRQCYVMVNGKQVGYYCGAQLADGKYEPNKYLSFIRPLPEVVQAAIAKKVADMTGGVSKYSAPPSEEHEVASDDE